jgi:hypothetical protein
MPYARFILTNLSSLFQIAAMAFVCVEEDLRRELVIQEKVRDLMSSPDPPNQYKPSEKAIKTHGYLRVLTFLLLVVTFGLVFPPFVNTGTYDNDAYYILHNPAWQLVDVRSHYCPHSRLSRNADWLLDIASAALERIPYFHFYDL